MTLVFPTSPSPTKNRFMFVLKFPFLFTSRRNCITTLPPWLHISCGIDQSKTHPVRSRERRNGSLTKCSNGSDSIRPQPAKLIVSKPIIRFNQTGYLEIWFGNCIPASSAISFERQSGSFTGFVSALLHSMIKVFPFSEHPIQIHFLSRALHCGQASCSEEKLQFKAIRLENSKLRITWSNIK